MTPEERAHNTWTIIAANNGFFHQEYFEQQIANAVRAAVEAEREACAQLIEAQGAMVRFSAREAIAAAIRAR